MVETPWLTVDEAAEYARKSRSTVMIALRDDTLRGAQTGRNGKWLIHREDLDTWIRGDRADVRVPATTRRRTA